MSDYLPGFLERVSAWVNAETSHKTATAVAVTTETDDWVGSTMDGYGSEMHLKIRLDDGDWTTVMPSELESLWHYVIGINTKENQS